MARAFAPIAAASLLLAGCGGAGEAPGEPMNEVANASAPPAPAQAAPAGKWDLQSSGEGTALALLSASGATIVRLFCPADAGRILVNVPGFRAVASEERLSFGSDGEVVALVADTRGDAQRGGVTGTGEVPANLAALVKGPVGVNYGYQNSGPHPAPPADLARAFVDACTEPAATAATTGANPCLTQGGERLDVTPLRAVGTEPFWGARIEGRCVTYATPEDQAGTRVWTRYAPAPGGGLWTGALGGQRFELRARAAPGCSDGMSDRRYPIAVDLFVSGERRRGCAAPA